METVEKSSNIPKEVKYEIDILYRYTHGVIFNFISETETTNNNNEKIVVVTYEDKGKKIMYPCEEKGAIQKFRLIIHYNKYGKRHGILHCQKIKSNNKTMTVELSNYLDDVLNGSSFKIGFSREYKLPDNNMYSSTLDRIHQTYKNGVLHGKFEIYKDNRVYINGNYVNGKKEGEFTDCINDTVAYYEAGILRRVVDFSHYGYKIVKHGNDIGQLHGNYKVYGKNDKLVTHTIWKDGKIKSIETLIDYQGRDQLVPKNGAFHGFKACKTESGVNVYVVLEIAEEAVRINAKPSFPSFSMPREDIFIPNKRICYKSRASSALVVKISDKYGNQYDECHSFVHKGRFSGLKYKKGHLVFGECYNNNPDDPCGGGINFHKYIDECDQWF